MNNGGIFQEEFGKLEQQVSNLKTTFVDTLSLSLTPTEQDKTFTKAFCVLFHASLEDFFEKISINLLRKAKKSYNDVEFITHEDISDINRVNAKIKKQIETYVMLVTYAVYYAGENKPTKEIEELTKMIESKYKHDTTLTELFFKSKNNQIVSNILNNANTILYKEVTEKNHGTSLKNLLAILNPAAINITEVGATEIDSLRIFESLRKLAYHRGDYAHLNQNAQISTLLSKTDLQEIIEDCMELCKEVKDLAIARF